MISLKNILFENVYEYFYHATLPENLPEIVIHGLIPSKNPHWGGDLGKFSYGKVCISDRFREANYYGNILWRDNPNRYRPILRFKYNKLRVISDPSKSAAHDFYVEYPIKAKFEIFVYNENTKYKQDSNGDIWFNDKTGGWRFLTKDIADGIATGEWDKENEDEDEEMTYLP